MQSHLLNHKVILGVLLGAFFWTPPGFARATGPGDPVVIRGAIEIFTVMDEWAAEVGVDLAVQQWGSLMGHPIAIRAIGAGCDSITALDVQKFVRRNNPLIIIGPSCSHTAMDVAKPLSDAKVIMISPSATDANLTHPQLRQPYFFRTAPNDKFEGIVAAHFANEFYESAGVFYMDPDPEIFPELFHFSALRLKDLFMEHFEGEFAGAIPIPEPYPFEESFPLFEEGLDQFEQKIPKLDLVYGPLFHENIQFDEGGMIALNHALRTRDPDAHTAMLSTEGLIHGAGLLYYYIFQVLFENPPDEIYATGTNFGGGPSYQEFVAAYQSYTGEGPNRFNRYASTAYDATNLALRALSLVAKDDGKGNLVISREDLQKALSDPGNYQPPFKGAAAVYKAPLNGDFNAGGYAVFKAIEAELAPEEGDFLLFWEP